MNKREDNNPSRNCKLVRPAKTPSDKDDIWFKGKYSKRDNQTYLGGLLK